MARRGFVANKRVIGRILREDPGIGAALDNVANPLADRTGGKVIKGMTDRQTRLVTYDPEEQAIEGVATKAINEVRAFRSRRAWRAAFARGDSNASDRAHESPGYRALPESEAK